MKINDAPGVSHARLKELLDFDQGTGFFLWKIRKGSKAPIGGKAGAKQSGGYLKVRIDGRDYFCHRIALFFVNGVMPIGQVDHINGVRADNRIANLRECNSSENNQNQRSARSSSTTGYLGVYPFKGKFQSAVRLNGKKFHLGTFDNAEKAHEAYLKAKRELHEFCTI